MDCCKIFIIQCFDPSLEIIQGCEPQKFLCDHCNEAFVFFCIFEKSGKKRQWPEVYDLCHTLLKRVRFAHVRVCFHSRNVQKRATKSDTSGHCLGKNEATDLAVSQLRGSTIIAIISAHVLGPHMWASMGPGQCSSSSNLLKTVGVGWSC